VDEPLALARAQPHQAVALWLLHASLVLYSRAHVRAHTRAHVHALVRVIPHRRWALPPRHCTSLFLFAAFLSLSRFREHAVCSVPPPWL
jgi:hypothetical protein